MGNKEGCILGPRQCRQQIHYVHIFPPADLVQERFGDHGEAWSNHDPLDVWLLLESDTNTGMSQVSGFGKGMSGVAERPLRFGARLSQLRMWRGTASTFCFSVEGEWNENEQTYRSEAACSCVETANEI